MYLDSKMFDCWKIDKISQAKVGKRKDSYAALQILRGKDTDISAEAAEIQVIIYFSKPLLYSIIDR